MMIPKIPLAEWIDQALAVVTQWLAPATQAISAVLAHLIHVTVQGLLWAPPWLLIALVALLAWRMSSRRVAIMTVLGLAFIWNLRLWGAALDTVTLVLITAFLCVLIGIPIGIMSAFSPVTRRMVMPVLDFMQTMPAFVYLIPAIPFFGLGSVAGIFATFIFAIPPTIRLTCVGIEQVPKNLIEAADAFGSTRWQRLFKVQFPMALPMIMAGINQTIMLALSMVVIAAMIGAGGLGADVWKAIQRLQAGEGFEAGIAIVIIAMILDRITQGIGRDRKVVS